MKSSIKSTIVRGVALVALTAVMAGCDRSPKADMNNAHATASSGCSSNPYLMKYNCSLSRIQHAAENGSADAQYALGYMYYYGIDTVKDRQTADLWIQRSAAQGQPLAKKAWSLINSGAAFTDLHKAAADQVAEVSRTSSTIVQQEPEDVNKLNAQVPSAPITSQLPGYSAQSGSTEPVVNSSSAEPKEKLSMHDPRLLPSAKPVVAMSSSRVSAPSTSDYTVQLMGSDKLHDVKSFITKNNLGNEAHFYKTQMSGKPWYILTYGDYKTPKQAEAAMEKLPSTDQDHHPWVKSLATVQKEVQLQKVIA